MQKATEKYKYEGFCDTGLTTNKQTRDLKTEESDELTAELEKLVADIQQLPIGDRRPRREYCGT